MATWELFNLIFLGPELLQHTILKHNYKIVDNNIAIINKKKEEKSVCKSLNIDLLDAVYKLYKQIYSAKWAKNVE